MFSASGVGQFAISASDQCLRLVFPGEVLARRLRLAISDSVRGQYFRAVCAATVFRPVFATSVSEQFSSNVFGLRRRAVFAAGAFDQCLRLVSATSVSDSVCGQFCPGLPESTG